MPSFSYSLMTLKENYLQAIKTKETQTCNFWLLLLFYDFVVSREEQTKKLIIEQSAFLFNTIALFTFPALTF
jgi:hypothetical protein